VQRARAAADADGLARAAEGREVALERGHGRTEDELRLLEHLQHRGIDLGLERAVLRLQIDERNHDCTALPSGTSRP
jgi:hypothetical protein